MQKIRTRKNFVLGQFSRSVVQKNFRIRKKKKIDFGLQKLKLGEDGKLILVLILINNDINIGITLVIFLYSESTENNSQVNSLARIST